MTKEELIRAWAQARLERDEAQMWARYYRSVVSGSNFFSLGIEEPEWLKAEAPR